MWVERQNVQATLDVAVSSNLKENMFIICDDLRTILVIPQDFPNTVAVKQNKQPQQMKDRLLCKFDTLFNDELNPPPMN